MFAKWSRYWHFRQRLGAREIKRAIRCNDSPESRNRIGIERCADCGGDARVLRDAAGVPIHGAGVHLKGKSKTFNATTGTDGQFRIELIPAGQYQLSVDANQDKIQYAAPINIVGISQAVVITLSAQKSLAVTSVADQRSATGGEELSSQTVSVLPLNKRDFSQLLLLAAGTMTDANGATNFTQQFAINGQRGVEAVFAMDGADISDPEMGGSTFSNFNVDAVEEIKSSSGWMPAEIGRGAAGFTNIVTRSGGDGFHGSVFEFVRNSAFDARKGWVGRSQDEDIPEAHALAGN